MKLELQKKWQRKLISQIRKKNVNYLQVHKVKIPSMNEYVNSVRKARRTINFFVVWGTLTP